MAGDIWTSGLLAATGLHAGFQATVTVVVYPALVHVPQDAWQDAHARHSRGIAPLVALVYAAALVTCAGAVLTGPDAFVWLTVAATLAAMGVTATLAAPTHGRLAGGPEPALLHRLQVVDRVRCAAAVLAFFGALLAAFA